MFLHLSCVPYCDANALTKKFYDSLWKEKNLRARKEFFTSKTKFDFELDLAMYRRIKNKGAFRVRSVFSSSFLLIKNKHEKIQQAKVVKNNQILLKRD